MELRHLRRAFVNGSSVSVIRLQSHNSLTLRTSPRGLVVFGLVASSRNARKVDELTVHYVL